MYNIYHAKINYPTTYQIMLVILISDKSNVIIVISVDYYYDTRDKFKFSC